MTGIVNTSAKKYPHVVVCPFSGIAKIVRNEEDERGFNRSTTIGAVAILCTTMACCVSFVIIGFSG